MEQVPNSTGNQEKGEGFLIPKEPARVLLRVSVEFHAAFDLGILQKFYLGFHVGFLIRISYQNFQTFMWVSLGLL